MSLLLAGALALGAAATVGSAISSIYTNKKNLDYSNKWNNTNLAYSKEQFEYQKMLNSNQYQIAAADMAKAGINPAMASGVNLSSGSYSSGANNGANQQPVDLSPITSLASTILSTESQQKISEASNSNQQSITDKNNATAKEVAEISANASMHNSDNQVQIAEDNRKSQELIAANKLKSDESIASANLSESKRASQASERNAAQVREDSYQWANKQYEHYKNELALAREQLKFEKDKFKIEQITSYIKELQRNMTIIASSFLSRKR